MLGAGRDARADLEHARADLDGGVRVGPEVVEPGRIVGMAALRGDEHEVRAVAQVDQRRRAAAAAARADGVEQQERRTAAEAVADAATRRAVGEHVQPRPSGSGAARAGPGPRSGPARIVDLRREQDRAAALVVEQQQERPVEVDRDAARRGRDRGRQRDRGGARGDRPLLVDAQVGGVLDQADAQGRGGRDAAEVGGRGERGPDAERRERLVQAGLRVEVELRELERRRCAARGRP